jgi:hypothetical protein
MLQVTKSHHIERDINDNIQECHLAHDENLLL